MNELLCRIEEAVGEREFEKALDRARNMLAYGSSKKEAMKELVASGVKKDLAFFAVVAARIMNKGSK